MMTLPVTVINDDGCYCYLLESLYCISACYSAYSCNDSIICHIHALCLNRLTDLEF